MTRLIDLNPAWVDAGGEGITDGDGKAVPLQRGVGINFDCPCGCGDRGFVTFERALDGSVPRGTSPKWKRDGITFNSLTLSPSIQRHKFGDHGCDWHGYIENGLTREA